MDVRAARLDNSRPRTLLPRGAQAALDLRIRGNRPALLRACARRPVSERNTTPMQAFARARPRPGFDRDSRDAKMARARLDTLRAPVVSYLRPTRSRAGPQPEFHGSFESPSAHPDDADLDHRRRGDVRAPVHRHSRVPPDPSGCLRDHEPPAGLGVRAVWLARDGRVLARGPAGRPVLGAKADDHRPVGNRGGRRGLLPDPLGRNADAAVRLLGHHDDPCCSGPRSFGPPGAGAAPMPRDARLASSTEAGACSRRSSDRPRLRCSRR